MNQQADIVYRNGAIYTVDSNRSWAEAVAIQAGRFVYVGDDAGVNAWIGEKTAVIDLQQKMVLPGLHDMHIHGLEGALARLYNCQFPMTATADEVVTAVAQFCTENPDIPFILGGSWHVAISADIAKEKLDAVCPDRPVFLWDASFHNGCCNSKMLELAGITAETADPAGGTIVRDDNGEATGLLLEEAATSVAAVIPDRSPEEYQAAVQWLANTLHALGVTSIKEAAVNRPMAQAYKTAEENGVLDLRVGLHFLWETPFIYDPADMEPLYRERHRFAGQRVKVDFLKLFLDGVPITKTACMLEPYEGDDSATHDPYELILVDRETLKEVLVRFDGEGVVVKMHATGDASLRAALDAIEAARVANGDSGLGHEIAHPQNVHPADLPRFAALGAVPDLNPCLWYPSKQKDEALLPLIGAERLNRNWPIASYLRSGAHMIGGTDWSKLELILRFRACIAFNVYKDY